jgi:hypothetical protein
MKKLSKAARQVIAEKVSSTIRVLELLEYDYEVTPPRHERRKGNYSPRVVYVKDGTADLLRVYNSIRGDTWANRSDGGLPLPVHSIEDLYAYLSKRRKPRRRARPRRRDR